MRISWLYLFTALLSCLLLFPAPGLPYELNGQVSSDLYAFQGLNNQYIRQYLRLKADLLAWRGAGQRSLRLVTSLRWASDYADNFVSDPAVFVYQTYARFDGLTAWTDLRVGRQFVYNGVGSALMDGGWIRIRPKPYLDIKLFGGSTVSSQDPETIRSLNDYVVAGGRIGYRLLTGTRLGLSYLLTQREGVTGRHRAGLDISQSAGPADLFGRMAMSGISHDLVEALARMTYRPELWYLSGEYQYRRPTVFANSIFAVVDSDPYQIGRLEARRRVWGPVSLVGHVQTDLTGENKCRRTALGFSSPSLSLSWIYQTGSGGDNNGLSGFFSRPITRRLAGYATARLYRYRVQEAQIDRMDAYASTAGLRFRAPRDITIVLEGQYLRNAEFTEDTRFLVRVSKRFSWRPDNLKGES